jgi:2-polyprenyl-3-methyl-5-hydroxy-6-metoxy-1,4-benzoquinol methylase
MTLTSKLRFAERMIRHRLNRQPCVCPYCGGPSPLKLLKRKKLILDIFRCDACGLIFRWPTESPEEADAYYQDEFSPNSPQISLPNKDELDALLKNNFAGTPLDLRPKIRLLKSVRPEGQVLDYGCSWGYGTYQLAQCGFQAMGFEISKPRAQYARDCLHVEVIDDLENLRQLPPRSFDVIFSNHVLEHLPNLKDALDLMARLLSDGGLTFHVLPNFTGKLALGGMWLHWIGEEHPIAPTMDFFARNLHKHGFDQVRFGSSPFNDAMMAAILNSAGQSIQAEGDELLLLASKPA